MTRRVALLLTLLAPTLVAAAAGPATLPTHDVTIIYRLEGAAADLLPGIHAPLMRLAWTASRQRLRLEPQGFPGYALIDLQKGTASLVDSAFHVAMSLPMRKQDLDPIRLDHARLDPTGHATVAGRLCTDYAVRSRHGDGTICLTPDGIPLRGAGTVHGRHGAFTATAVNDAPLPETMFTPPPTTLRLSQ